MTSTDVLAVADTTLRVERRDILRPGIPKHAPDPSAKLGASMYKSYQADSAGTESARFEVQNLSDVLPTLAPGKSKIAERIQENRRPRHEQALEDMKHELARITAELEPRINQAADQLKQNLAEEHKATEELMNNVDTKKCLHSFTLMQLKDLWSSVAQHTPTCQRYLSAFEETLNKIESDRSAMVTEVISHYGSMLQAVAYLLPDEVTKLMEDTAHSINLALIANKRSYAALVRHLKIVELMKERDLHEQWEDIVGKWREEVCSDVISKFRSYMESDTVKNPPELQKVKALLRAEQTAVTRQREELLNQFSIMRPPNATKLMVYEWNEKVLRLQHQLEHIHNTYLVQLQQCSETTMQHCQQEMEKYKCFLVDSQVHTSTSVYEVLNNHFVPLVEACSVALREQLQAAERSLDLVLGSQQAQFQALFQYAQGAASLWDNHMTAVHSTQTQHQDDLVKRRTHHDLANQNLEANLDIVLDRLRQCPAKEALSTYLEEAHRLLSMINEGYTTFYSDMLADIPKLLPLIKGVLETYDSSLCKYLGVARHPIKGKKSKKQPSTLSHASSSTLNLSRDSKRGSKTRPYTQSRAGSVASSSSSPLPSIVEEVIATTGGTSFYVQSLIEDAHLGPTIFLTQDEEAEGATGTFATEGLTISDEAFVSARNQLRASFLDQLEAWKMELISKTEEVVAGKLEETHTELDIRTHLHSPRLGRVDDIGHTREAELTAHKDRVLRHSNGVLHALDETKTLMESLSEKQNKLVEQCSTELQTMEESFYSVDRLNRLTAMEGRLDELVLKHEDIFKTLEATHLKAALEVLSDLMSSNNSFRTSLKSFSEGGNYCREEIESFTRKMGRLSTKIEGMQASITNEVHALTEMGLKRYQEAVATVKLSLQAHIMDVSFLQAISTALADAQIKIKCEVAISNGQSQNLSESVQKLKVLVEQCRLEKTEPSAVLVHLTELLASSSNRVDYLCCRAASQQSRRASEPEVSNQPQGPISAVNITRSILEVVLTKKKMDPENEPPFSSKNTKHSVSGSQSVLDSQSEAVGHKIESALSKSHKKPGAQEKKNVSFGSNGGEDGTQCFLPKIRAILVNLYTQLLQLAEAFYKQKGSHPITRKDHLKDTFELCMDHLMQKCQSYRGQAEEYRNDCIQELHEQLEQLITVSEEVPVAVFTQMRKEHQTKAEKEWKAAMDTKLKELEKSSKEAESHLAGLCPAIGHPSRKQTLEQLCTAEQERHTKALEDIRNHSKVLKVLALAHANNFILDLHVTAKKLIACADSITCPYDIASEGKRLKSKQIPDSAATTEDTLPPSNGNTIWSGFSQTALASLFGFNDTENGKPEAFATIEPFTSQKNSRIHFCIIKARDRTFEDYTASLTEQLQCLIQDEQMECNGEGKRFNHWVQSVQRVKDLYKVPT